jgi:hypothetical protein
MYAIYNARLGYVRADEDATDGLGYAFEIDEYTVLFDKRETAERERSPGERIVEISECPSCERQIHPDTASSHTYTLDGSTYFKTYVTYCPRCLHVIETDARL